MALVPVFTVVVEGEDAAVVVVVEVDLKARVKIADSVNSLRCPLAASEKIVPSFIHLARITLNLFLDRLLLAPGVSKARATGCLNSSHNNPTWEHKGSSSQVSNNSNSLDLAVKEVNQKERVGMATNAINSRAANANLIIPAQPSHHNQVETIMLTDSSNNMGNKTSSQTARELLSSDLMELVTDLQPASVIRSNASSITFLVPKKSHSDCKSTKASLKTTTRHSIIAI